MLLLCVLLLKYIFEFQIYEKKNLRRVEAKKWYRKADCGPYHIYLWV